MLFSIFVSPWLLLAAFVSAKGYLDLPRRDLIVERAASDPCCKSCAPIQQNGVDCPVATSDIFCGCDSWVRAAPTCQTCIVNALYNTSFAVNPGPALEFFWTWCQCQQKCRDVASALFAPTPCNFGQNNTCVSQHIVSGGPKCLPCMERIDPWMASWFALEIKDAAEFLVTKKSAVPGLFHIRSHDSNHFLIRSLRLSCIWCREIISSFSLLSLSNSDTAKFMFFRIFCCRLKSVSLTLVVMK